MSRPALGLVLAFLVLASGFLGWKCAADPGTVYLPRDSRAEWITYASAPSLFARPRVELETVFTRVFDLERVEPGAAVHARFQNAGDVTINGIRFGTDDAGPSWKRERTFDVAAALRPGRNEIVARARSSFGPAALWLALDSGGIVLRTDGTWLASLAGATELPARPASVPMSEWSMLERGGDTLPSSVGARAPTTGAAFARGAARIGLLALIAALLVAAGGWIARRRGTAIPIGIPIAAVAAAALWAPLFLHNRELSPRLGFDNDTHAQYVEHVLAQGRLPLADEGWEMYQPPLYYLVAAAVVKLGGFPRLDADAVRAVRWIGFLAGVLQVAFVVGSARILFPDLPRRAVLGFVIAVFLPVQLYLGQYVTNEGFAAMLVSAAVYLALRILARDDARVRSHALLGAVLGLAMLAKFSALFAVVAALLVLAGRLAGRRVREPAAWLRTVGAVLVACLLVCGWHFARVAARFGDPFIGNWDPATGFAWWQDPGYWTCGDFARFGAALVQPVYAATSSVPDAVYSTLWGDGLVAGQGAATAWPPWDYGAMAAGYLLALAPTLALAAGFLAALVRLVREPRAEWFLLLALLLLTALGVLAMTLKIPSYAQAKAFYGSAALVPLCAIGALGVDVLAGRSRALRAIVLVLIGTWALNAYASFWSVGGAPADEPPAPASAESARALYDRAVAESTEGRAEEALATAARAAEIDPASSEVQALLAVLLIERGETDSAFAAARRAVRLQPADANLHALVGEMYRASGDLDRARLHDEMVKRIRAR